MSRLSAAGVADTGCFRDKASTAVKRIFDLRSNWDDRGFVALIAILAETWGK